MARFEDDKFIVLPTKYVEQMPSTLKTQLAYVCDRVRTLRSDAKGEYTPVPKYYVCNQDEPYAQDVLNTILLGEERKEAEHGQ